MNWLQIILLPPVFLLVCILILLGVLLLLSSGKLKPFVDEKGRPLTGSISEKTFVTINGVK